MFSNELVGSIGYSNFAVDDVDLDLGVVTATLGYKFSSETSNFSLTPELRVGVGAGDDTFSGVTFEIDQTYGLNVRGQWDFSNNTYFFVAPSYMNLEL